MRYLTAFPLLALTFSTAYSSDQNPPLERRALVIDDDELNRTLVSRTIRKSSLDKGIKLSIDTAENGAEGLEKYMASVYDLVVTDLNMPGEIQGDELGQQIREIPRSRRPSLVLYSSQASKVQSKTHDDLTVTNELKRIAIERPKLEKQLAYWQLCLNTTKYGQKRHRNAKSADYNRRIDEIIFELKKLGKRKRYFDLKLKKPVFDAYVDKSTTELTKVTEEIFSTFSRKNSEQ